MSERHPAMDNASWFDEKLRVQALELANDGNLTTDEIVDRAAAFLRFLKGDDVEADRA